MSTKIMKDTCPDPESRRQIKPISAHGNTPGVYGIGSHNRRLENYLGIVWIVSFHHTEPSPSYFIC